MEEVIGHDYLKLQLDIYDRIFHLCSMLDMCSIANEQSRKNHHRNTIKAILKLSHLYNKVAYINKRSVTPNKNWNNIKQSFMVSFNICNEVVEIGNNRNEINRLNKNVYIEELSNLYSEFDNCINDYLNNL